MEIRKPTTLPKIWAGATVYILGGGPSLNDYDLTPLHDKKVIGVNQAFRLGPWVDVLYFGDCSFYKDNLLEIRKFAGLKISSCARMPAKGWPGVLRLRRGKPFGIEKEGNALAWNNNSGASAINIAVLLGATRIILLGFDMRKVDTQHNWHSHYKPRGKKFNPYGRHLRSWPVITGDARAMGIELINTTPDSAIATVAEIIYKPLEECL